MSPWYGNSIFLVSIAVTIAIRLPHQKVSQKTKVSESRKSGLEELLLMLVRVGMVLPVLSFTSLLSFANYPPRPAAVASGTVLLALGLWLFYRSHADLGKNWSMSLEIREGHSLVTGGLYRYIRHPMYTSMILMGIGQAFVLSNWLAGPALLLVFTLMFLSRVGREERMMLDQFGAEYEAYRRQTKRLIPFVW